MLFAFGWIPIWFAWSIFSRKLFVLHISRNVSHLRASWKNQYHPLNHARSRLFALSWPHLRWVTDADVRSKSGGCEPFLPHQGWWEWEREKYCIKWWKGQWDCVCRVRRDASTVARVRNTDDASGKSKDSVRGWVFLLSHLETWLQGKLEMKEMKI